MAFAEEDVLAITTVAAAAYRILRDVKEKRGERAFADDFRDTYLGVARAFVRGDLPEKDINLFRNSAMWPVISLIAEGIKKAGADRSIVDLRSIVEVKVPTHAERQHWNEVNRT